MNRRSWIALGLTSFCAMRQRMQAQTTSNNQKANVAQQNLSLGQYTPKSMLKVSETKVPRSRYPVIDFHTHITLSDSAHEGTIHFDIKPESCLEVMKRKNIRTMVDLTGGCAGGLQQSLQGLSKAHPGQFLVFTEPAWAKASDPGYAKYQGDQIADAHKAGAKGIKVLKTLGLYLREKNTHKLVRVDDPRFDPMWEAAGSLKMPVAIHVSDPRAFFLPIDQNNERWEELHAHPDWSFYGKDFPSNHELQEARRTVMRRHPKTQFVCLHVADAEDLGYVSECMDQHPNMHVDIAARIGELGRQPRAARQFFDRYQDRILFGTDASGGNDFPQQSFCDALYEIYYRFLETEDEYFDYAPAAIPPQGRWRIYGLGLPDGILRKVYQQNAARLLGLTV